MKSLNLTFGYIPLNCEKEYINPSDLTFNHESIPNYLYKTVFLKVDNWYSDDDPPQSAKVLVFKNSHSDEQVSISEDQFWTSTESWAELILEKFLKGIEVDKKINPQKIALAWEIFQEDVIEFEGVEIVSWGGDEGGFENENGKYNGYFFIQYIICDVDDEDDEEWYDERIVVFN